MAIAVIGSAGQLGHDICSLLGSRAIALTRDELDITVQDSIDECLRGIAPESVINAAAYNLVDLAENNPNDAMSVNYIGVKSIAESCSKLQIPLVHFSSDYVFGLNVQQAIPYEETDVPGPISVYAMSKLAGEYAVRAASPDHCIIRTCGLYGHHGVGGKGTNFVETMLKLGAEREQLRVVSDQRCTPTFTLELAGAALQLLEKNARGVYHWTNDGDCSWYEFAKKIFELAEIGVECVPISSEEYGVLAPRPSYSVLSTAKIQRTGLNAPRHWSDALAEYLAGR